jgi:hypothetical protein
MRGAERAAAAGDRRGATRQGELSAAALDSVAAGLRDERDSVAQAWRAEALGALDRALAETAALAEQQADVAEAMRRGETGAGVRARQGAVEDGAAAVELLVREAGARNALVSPQLEAALALAQRQMRGARDQLNQAQPNPAAATALADEALDALNATAHALARARGDVAGAASGTGFAEAVEQLSRMAGQQRGITGDAQGLLPMLAGETSAAAAPRSRGSAPGRAAREIGAGASDARARSPKRPQARGGRPGGWTADGGASGAVVPPPARRQADARRRGAGSRAERTSRTARRICGWRRPGAGRDRCRPRVRVTHLGGAEGTRRSSGMVLEYHRG